MNRFTEQLKQEVEDTLDEIHLLEGVFFKKVYSPSN